MVKSRCCWVQSWVFPVESGGDDWESAGFIVKRAGWYPGNKEREREKKRKENRNSMGGRFLEGPSVNSRKANEQS